MTKRILVPVDGTEAAHQASDFVVSEFPDATLVLLHVINPAEAGYSAQASIPSFSEEWYEREKEQAESLFDEIEAEGRERRPGRQARHRGRQTHANHRRVRPRARHRPDRDGKPRPLGDVLNSTRERRRERRQALAGPGHGDALSSRRVRRREFCMFALEGTVTTTARKPLGGLDSRGPRCAPRGSRERSSRHHERRGAPSNDSAAVLTGPCFVHPASPFESTVRASSDETRSKIGDFRHDETASPSRTTSFASLTRTPGTAPQPCPSLVGRRDGLPGHAVVEGSVIRRGRAESGRNGALNISACRRPREQRGPGGLKGRGALAEARTRKHRTEWRRAAWSARGERAEGFRSVCGCDRSEKARPHQWLTRSPVLTSTPVSTNRERIPTDETPYGR